MILEACRRNNTDLLSEVLTALAKSNSKGNSKSKSPTELIATTLNTARDGIGNGVLHLAASTGSYDVLDLLLDQEGLEIDELDRLERDTPLHKAVRFVNSLDKEEWAEGHAVVEILLDAGCDPRIRNKAKLKPGELADPRNAELRAMLQRAEFAVMAGDDVVKEDGDDGQGSGSESD